MIMAIQWYLYTHFVSSSFLFKPFYSYISLEIALQIKDSPTVKTCMMPCQLQIQFCLAPASATAEQGSHTCIPIHHKAQEQQALY